MVALALARVGDRRFLGAMVGLAILVAAGIGVAHASLEAARRTETAYSSYRGRADVGDVVINPSLNTRRVAEILEAAPGVESVTSDALLTATADRGSPGPEPRSTAATPRSASPTTAGTRVRTDPPSTPAAWFAAGPRRS